MDIQEIKERRTVLALKITEMVRKFEEDAEVLISEIKLVHVKDDSGAPYLRGVAIGLEIIN